MKKFLSLLFFVLLCLLLTLTVWADEEESPTPYMPALSALDDGWNTLVPGGDTICGRGTPYQFFVRKTEHTDKLMIYFQGGGACWNFFTCRPNGGTFDASVSPLEDEIGRYGGVFDYTNTSNPLMDYNVVFVPYCTADVHIGQNVVTHGDVTIYHNGAVNSRAVLDWTYEHFLNPETILVTGSSAGAYGAIYFAPEVIEQYPSARVVQFGDGGVGATPAGWRPLLDWDIYANMYPFDPPIDDPDTFTINQLYAASAQAFPQTVFSQFTHAFDGVQERFYSFSVAPGATPWQDIMYSNLEVLEPLDNFALFIAGSADHTILAMEDFYKISANGVRFVDWFTALLNGDPVDNPRCEVCTEAERVEE